MHVTAIIQARMGSTRLPGKVLMEVKGKPLLGYLVDRVGRANSIDKVVIATSVLDQDEPIVSFCKSIDIECFQGAEEDVLDRYYQAAKHAGASTIMRITGDCPLLEPEVCDQCVKAFQEKQVDYLQTSPEFAEGFDCEIFSFDVLERSWKDATLLSEREHVTLFIRNHPEMFSMSLVRNHTDDSWIRVTVDCQEDFDVVESILQSSDEGKVTIEYIRDYLKNNPSVYALNSRVVRNEGLLKSLKNDKVVR